MLHSNNIHNGESRSPHKLLILAALPFFMIACQTADAPMANNAAPTSTERPATSAEIQSFAVGRTLASGQTFNTDGTYRFQGQNPGRYTITDGRVCVTFSSGRRCDRIVTNDGTTYTLIDTGGRRFPFG